VRQWRGQLTDRTASHKAHPPRLLAGASVVEAQRLGGGSRGSPNWWGQTRQAAAWWSVAAASMAVREQAARWRRPRVTRQRGGEFFSAGSGLEGAKTRWRVGETHASARTPV
jgi:hypothetical protein